MTMRLTVLCTSAMAALLASQPALAGEPLPAPAASLPASSLPGADIPGAQGGPQAVPPPAHGTMIPVPAAPMAGPGVPVMMPPPHVPIVSGHIVPAYPGGPLMASPYAQGGYPASPYPTHAYPQAYPGAAAMAPQSYPPEYQQARADWVAECARRYRADRRNGNGGLLGGLLGAVVGGVIGNRVDDGGSRWGGTLLGAGVGGIAGAVIGSAIDRGNRRKHDDEALDWCEDYLARASAQPAYGYGAPMMMVPVMVPVRRCHTHEVVERVVEKPVYRTIPAPTKRVKAGPAPVKSIK